MSELYFRLGDMARFTVKNPADQKPLNNLSTTTPRIVKFSGGRSSAMMLLMLLEDQALDQARGDVVIFNNTSAEHPATYDFTRRIKRRVEAGYGIPFFWIEYFTYEDAFRGEWVRNPAFRLVNDQPYSKDNLQGYHFHGEVFEELMSAMASVPNMQTRICTQHMKIFTTNAFLSDWLAMKPRTSRLGHYGETSRMTDEGVIAHHKKNNGAVPDEVLLQKKQFVRQCMHYRPAQTFQDFTQADTMFSNPEIKLLGSKAMLYGQDAVTYISCLGIRADEAHRVDKIRLRIEKSPVNNGTSLFNQPPGEKVHAPLVDNGISVDDVSAFWKQQDFDLALPHSGLFSNCLYCMMKGREKLVTIAREEINQAEQTPVSIDWWVEMERKYSRDLIAEKRKRDNREVKHIGFFGASSQQAFAMIRKEARTGAAQKSDAEYLVDESYDICNCTD